MRHVTYGPELLGQLIGAVTTGDALASLLDALPDAIAVVDADGRIRYVNARVRELTGHVPADLVGRPVEVLIPEQLREDHVRHRRDYTRDPTVRPMGANSEIQASLAGGGSVPVDISLSPITVDGELFVVASLRDAGPRRVVERTLRAALEHEQRVMDDLRTAGRQRDGFVRTLSHDLRSPLFAMLGLADTAATHLEDLSADEVRDLLERIVRNGQRLDDLLTDIVELERSSWLGRSIERVETDLPAFVREVIDRLEDAAPTVRVEDANGLRWPVARDAFARIVDNLVLNTVKHAPSSGPVDVRFERGDDEIVLVIEDRGPGVPASDRERIFEPFVRGARSDETPGTGLGLSIVAQLADAHGGRAWVEDRPGGGASFRVSLPVAPG